MKLKYRAQFLTAAALAIGTATFSFADDRPSVGSTSSDRNTSSNTNQNDSSRTDRQDRSTDSNRTSSSNDASNPDAKAVSQTISKTVEAALSGDMRQLSQNFTQDDQRRFDQAKGNQQQQQNSRLQQATADLKRNFHEKYNKDLTLADASQTFGSDFIRPASGASDINDRARPAGSQIGGSSGTSSGTSTGNNASGTSGTSSGTSGTTGGTAGTNSNPNIGDGTTGPRGSGSAGAPRTINSNSGTSGNGSPGSTDTNTGIGSATARGTAMQGQSFEIPASHGLPAAHLSMVKEGSDFKINVPDSLTPDRLQDNLARELSRANDMKAQWPNDATQAERALAHHVMLALTDQDSSRTGNGADRNSGTDRDRDRSTGPDRDRSSGSNTGSGTSGVGGTSSGTTGGGSGTTSGNNNNR